MASKAAKIWKRTWVGFALVAVLVALLWLAFQSADGLVVWGLGVVITIGALFELARMDQLAPRHSGPILFGAFALSCLPAALHFSGQELPGLLPFEHAWAVPQSYALALTACALAAALWARSGLGFLVISALWLCVPLPALWQVWHEFGPEGLSALLLLSKIGDVLGYYVGSSIGKSHPFPTISPGKTSAGCVASLLAGTLAGGGCVALGLLPGGSSGLWAGFAAGGILNLAAQAGDLFESKQKRAARVKDSGNWFGPSGGVLDLVDSLLFSIPAALCSWPLLFGR